MIGTTFARYRIIAKLGEGGPRRQGPLFHINEMSGNDVDPGVGRASYVAPQ
jgi:hypothetical protein